MSKMLLKAEMFMYGGFRFLYYLSEETKFDPVTYLTTTKIF